MKERLAALDSLLPDLINLHKVGGPLSMKKGRLWCSTPGVMNWSPDLGCIPPDLPFPLR